MMGRTLIQIWPEMTSLQNDIDTYTSITDKITKDSWLAIIGRYAESHIIDRNEMQFKAQFLTILSEAYPKLLAKLTINEKLRKLTEAEALDGGKIIANNAKNPDSEPADSDTSELPYINDQSVQKETIGRVRGLYDWKNTVGGQAYNEFLDRFKPLFRVILVDIEEFLYE